MILLSYLSMSFELVNHKKYVLNDVYISIVYDGKINKVTARSNFMTIPFDLRKKRYREFINDNGSNLSSTLLGEFKKDCLCQYYIYKIPLLKFFSKNILEFEDKEGNVLFHTIVYVDICDKKKYILDFKMGSYNDNTKAEDIVFCISTILLKNKNKEHIVISNKADNVIKIVKSMEVCEFLYFLDGLSETLDEIYDLFRELYNYLKDHEKEVLKIENLKEILDRNVKNNFKYLQSCRNEIKASYNTNIYEQILLKNEDEALKFTKKHSTAINKAINSLCKETRKDLEKIFINNENAIFDMLRHPLLYLVNRRINEKILKILSTIANDKYIFLSNLNDRHEKNKRYSYFFDKVRGKMIQIHDFEDEHIDLNLKDDIISFKEKFLPILKHYEEEFYSNVTIFDTEKDIISTNFRLYTCMKKENEKVICVIENYLRLNKLLKIFEKDPNSRTLKYLYNDESFKQFVLTNIPEKL